MNGAETTGEPSLSSSDSTTIGVTPAARAAIEHLVAEHGPLMFIESHGCCDNSAPMCFPEGDFLVGTSDVKIAEVAGCPYYVDARTLGFRNTGTLALRMELDVEPGFSDGMSLGPEGSHFVVRLVAPGALPAAIGETSPPERGEATRWSSPPSP